MTPTLSGVSNPSHKAAGSEIVNESAATESMVTLPRIHAVAAVARYIPPANTAEVVPAANPDQCEAETVTLNAASVSM